MRVTTLSLVMALIGASTCSAQTPALVHDFFPGSTGSFINHGHPNAFRVVDGRLLLFANDGDGLGKLYALNDLSGNVDVLAHEGGVLGYTTTNGGIIASGDNIFFFGQQPSSANAILWCVHGSSVDAIDTIPYQVLFDYTGIPLPGGKLVYPGSDPEHGFEPWVTDGTVAGTHRLKDINSGTNTSIGTPFPLFQGFDFGGKAYFMASDGSNGMQLWTSDGTESGTQQFAVINEASASGAIQLRYSKNADKFIVGGLEGVIASDGNAANNTLIHTSMFGWPNTAGLNYPDASDGWMYFTSLDDQWALYRTQGTEATTELMVSGIPNQGFYYLTELNGLLYTLTADNNNAYLKSIDPATHTMTTAKTFAPDPQSGPNPGAFYGFRNDGQHFYFMGKEGTHARQYWKSDGTDAGTQMVYEFMPTLVNGGPDAVDGNMIIFNGHFVFTANDATVGAELWAAEGTAGIATNEQEGRTLQAWYDASGQVNVRVSDGILGSVQLLDATGRVLETRNDLSGAQALFSMRGRASGVYLVQVLTGAGRQVARVVVP